MVKDSMSHLAELSLNISYRSNGTSILHDFYNPCLERAILYRRAVGYFTSSGLAVAAKGLAKFISHGGRMKLVASPKLGKEDIEAIEKGYKSRAQTIESAINKEIKEIEDALTKDRLSALAWMISTGTLEIKLALPVDEQGEIKHGLYHEKIGIFTDLKKNTVAFTGSPNETQGGLIDNFESIDVFWSWEDPQKRTEEKIRYFNSLWQKETPGLAIYSFPEACKEELLKYKKATPPEKDLGLYETYFPVLLDSESPKLWDHQKNAIDIFMDQKKGILEMATGTGKIHIALELFKILVGEKKVNSVIISAPGKDLLYQWKKQITSLASGLNQKFRVLSHFDAFHQRDDFELDPENSILIVSRIALHPILKRLDGFQKSKTLIVHDEVHGLGSLENVKNLDGLSNKIPYILGLSATPEREYDQDGNEFINRNVGPVIFTFGIEDAIRKGILCEFDYFPLEYHLSQEDGQKIRQIYKQKIALEKAGTPMSEEAFRTKLARVYKISRSKIRPFVNFLEDHPEALERCIVFVHERDFGDDILNIIHRHSHEFHTYYAEDDKSNLQGFAAGDIKCLITCHKISEGIDIKSLRSVILFSSDKSRLETIQRMGRCLRVDPKNLNKKAMIIDFIRAQDPTKPDLNVDQQRSIWLRQLAMTEKEDA